MRRTALTSLSIAACALVLALPAQGASLSVTPGAAAVGGWGLEIALGPPCSSGDQLSLGAGQAPLAGPYEACRTIDTSGAAVDAGGATLTAGIAISLGNGFSVPTGAPFTAVIDGALLGGGTFIESPAPIDENLFNARFSLRADGATLAAGQTIDHLTAFDGGGEAEFTLLLRGTGSGLELTLSAHQDGGGYVLTPPGQEIPIPAGWNEVELQWSAGDTSGQLLVSLNGGAFQGLSTLANALSTIESVRWGAVAGAVETSSGVLQIDNFSAWR